MSHEAAYKATDQPPGPSAGPQPPMDDDNRISITVCGDGGCGTLLLLEHYKLSDGIDSRAFNRQIIHNITVGAKPMDTRVSH